MDEPLGALDKQLREHMQIELKQLHEQLGVTFVYVTHDQSEALTMSDRVAVFNNGVIAADRHAGRSCTTTPANRFVAGFIGENNLLRRHASNASAADAAPSRCPTGAAARRWTSAAPPPGAPVASRHPARARRGCSAATPRGDNVLPRARCAAAIYFGDHLRLIVRAARRPGR